MFKISFHQFRCWENLSIQVPIGEVTLIKGNSGIGKTTIFQGITWCLYGNLRLVAPNHLEKAKTSVCIEFPYSLNGSEVKTLSINRQKNPNRLILTHGESVFEDKVAQSIIDDLFGVYDIWMASCYIGQGCRNSFLTAPNTGKMDFLNSIAFHEEDPSVYIERIDNVITETDSEYKSKLAVFTNRYNEYQNIINTIDVSKALTPEQTSDINTKITALETEKLQLQADKSKRDVNIGMLENLRRHLETATAKIIVIPTPDPILLSIMEQYNINVDHLDEIINELIETLSLLQQRDYLESEVNKCDNLLIPYRNFKDNIIYTKDDYQNAVSKETSYNDNLRLAQSLGVSYNETSINESIRRYRDLLNSQDRLKLEKERDTIRLHINKLEYECSQNKSLLEHPVIIPNDIQQPDYSKYSTRELSEQLSELSKQHGALQNHIQHLHTRRDILQCPKCDGALRYQNGGLVTADSEPANMDEITSSQMELSKINTEISNINQKIQYMNNAEAVARRNYEQSIMTENKRIETLREKARLIELEQQRRDIDNRTKAKSINDLKEQLKVITDKIELLPDITDNHRLLSDYEIDQTHSLIGRLSNIIIKELPEVSSREIQTYINYNNIAEQRNNAISIRDNYINTIPIKYRTETTANVTGYINKLRTYKNIVKDATEEKIRIDRLKESLETQITSINEQILIDPLPRIEQITSQILELNNSLLLSRRAHQALEFHKIITKEREDVVNLNASLSDLMTFRQHAVETECRILQQVVDSINASIQNVCTSLFDRDINIMLNLFKTMKTTKNVKPMANFTISYQGGTFDNINQMSGGEGDRASLALTLALNRLSSCPILMLDESLASLDLNMKEAAIRTIRENTTNTVLVIMHDGVEGVFGSCINFDELSQGRY